MNSNLKLSEIVEKEEYTALDPFRDQTVSGIAYDSRKIAPGDLFVALVGEKSDGHRFLAQAREKGAIAGIVQKNREIENIENFPLFETADTRLALAEISARFFEHPSRAFSLVGVTGTNGKTTTTHLIEAIFRAAGMKAGVIGTLGSHFEEKAIPTHHTTPQALELQEIFAQMKETGIQGVAMEVSSHALDQDRVAFSDFDVAVLTNVTVDHLDYHKDMEKYAAAKMKLFKGLPGSHPRTAVLNADEKKYSERFQDLIPSVLTYAIEREADFRATEISLLAAGSKWRMTSPHGSIEIELNLPGRFNVYNALAAAAAAFALGIDLPSIQKGLSGVSGVPGRVEVVSPKDHPFTVLVDYAHTPDGLENVLSTARGFTRNRLIAVFGCGGDRDRTKRPVMGRIGTELSDLAILTSDNPRSEDPEKILAEVAAGVEKSSFRLIVDRAEAIKKAIEAAGPGDVVVIAGKGHEDYQIFKDRTIHFDDREEARKALRCSL
ncbi:MAG TPA: UDP-N-acetylmuramoyl-L-alanyl-D-glutamate--2,6-diaminopimelate ligase [Chroococcales cyanobacterium]